MAEEGVSSSREEAISGPIRRGVLISAGANHSVALLYAIPHDCLFGVPTDDSRRDIVVALEFGQEGVSDEANESCQTNH
ncbi:hypothetical protein U1Q18_001650 [Sarracenia purpurea var. burkii]